MASRNYVNPRYCVAYTNGECTFGPTCSLRHDIYKCSCGLILPFLNCTVHENGQRHAKALATLQPPKPKKRKPAAKTTRNVAQNAQDHHQQQYGSEGALEFVTCERCRKNIVQANYAAHVEEHRVMERQAQMQAELEEAANDKQGVIVNAHAGIDFGIVDTESAVEVVISIQSTASQIYLRSLKMQSSTRRDRHGVQFSARLRGQSRVIHVGKTRQVAIVLHPSFPGCFHDTLELEFYNIDAHSNFIITRRVEATVGSREDHELLRPKAPYSPRKIMKFNPVGVVVPSNRPPVWTQTTWVQKLPRFDIPPHVTDAIATPGNGAWNAIKRLMPAKFNIRTYGSWFQVLLYLEEERMRLDLDAYSLTDAELLADYPRYRLLVKGLAEGRPSVLVGDFIRVNRAESEDTWYEGRVHKVQEKHVSLHFGDSFSVYRGTKFNVRFVLNRLPLRRMHQAMTNKYDPPRILFPGPEHIQGASRVTLDKIVEINPFYRPLREDEEQMETVAAIVNQRPGSVPFVVFGPPGTGKTVTIVEAMRQLLHKDPNVRILACAPSNSAADNIARNLTDLGKTTLFRLNALSRKVGDMSDILRGFSSINNNLVFSMPDIEQLRKYRVIVSTCLSGSVPSGLGLKKGHFTHIFVDEAGQGKEPEIMVPIKNNAGPNTNIILAGDNQQLGPLVNSPFASMLGLKVSYLDRIMNRPIYDLESGRGITIVKLVKNFRSHPDILNFSNDNFYASELQTCGEQAITHSLQNYEGLPKQGFPVIFHSIVGKDEREANSPSFFNIAEATQVKKYCLSLIENRKNKTKGEHIGVITPYHAQRCKILDLFHRDAKLRDITVGSVEEFQGQERRVIIMTTVRSNTNYVSSDIRRSLGFVANKNRLNVALTRAQALLIVIGNPVVLSLDPLWRGFLNYVYMRGGWLGKQIDWNPTDALLSSEEYSTERRMQVVGEMEETIARLQAMIIDTHNNIEIDWEEDAEAAAFERPILREAE